jgi:predicted nucleotidyltransferase
VRVRYAGRAERARIERTTAWQEIAMRNGNLAISQQHLAEFCRKYGIRKLSFYGSVLRRDFRPESDVDVLVEFEPGRLHGLSIINMEQELSALLGGGHKVDIVSEKYLNPRLRDRIVESAEVQYAEV